MRSAVRLSPLRAELATALSPLPRLHKSRMSLIDQGSFATWTCAITAAITVVLVTYGCFRSHERDATSTVAPKARPPRASKAAVAKQKAVSKQKTTPAAAGLARQCYFCEVLVTAEQTDAHCRGKKHQRLVGSTATADCWCWVVAAAEPDGSPDPSRASAATPATAAAAEGGNGAKPVSTGGWQPVTSGKKGRRPAAAPATTAAAAAPGGGNVKATRTFYIPPGF